MFGGFSMLRRKRYEKELFRQFFGTVFSAVGSLPRERVWLNRAKTAKDLCPGGILKPLRVGFGKSIISKID
jgi:hypothetical protein